MYWDLLTTCPSLILNFYLYSFIIYLFIYLFLNFKNFMAKTHVFFDFSSLVLKIDIDLGFKI